MTVHWGILGAGDIADRQMAPAIRLAHNHELVAVMCRTIEKARAFAQKHTVPRAYDQVEDLLSDNQVNAVYVATPPYLHAQNAIRAAECGKHVLCEKPMALNAAEARAMIDACRSNHVGLMVCHYQRFNARHQRIKGLLETGAIGPVTAVRINFSDYYPATSGNWRHNPSLSGGGPLLDLAPHCLDLLLYLCGPVLEVSAMTDVLASDSPVEDTATILLRLANGVQAVVTTHWSTANLMGMPSAALNFSEQKGRSCQRLFMPRIRRDSFDWRQRMGSRRTQCHRQIPARMSLSWRLSRVPWLQARRCLCRDRKDWLVWKSFMQPINQPVAALTSDCRAKPLRPSPEE